MSKQWMMALLIVSAKCGTALAWNGYEHSEIGDAAFARAIATLDSAAPGTSAKLLRSPHLANLNSGSRGKAEPICAVANGRDVACFSFGDLVAIYGDYAETFGEVNSSAIGPRADALKDIVTKGNYAVYKSEKRRMVELAARNVSHFSGEAVQAYVQWHKRALELAPQKDRFWEALHYEALALHSFSDLFAFGHMLENREMTGQLVTWANKQQTWLASVAAAGGGGAMGGVVNFYHNAYNFKGAMVKNLAGVSWRAFGDGRYRIVDASCAKKSYTERKACDDPATKAQRDIIVAAVAMSLHEVLSVASGKPLAAGTEYAALAHVPVDYWDTQGPIHPQHQLVAVTKLGIAMRKQGRPIEDNGFDFSLGYLKYAPAELKGRVDYANLVRQQCCNGKAPDRLAGAAVPTR